MVTQKSIRRARGRVVAAVLLCTWALVLAGCHQAPPTGNASPDTAIAASLRLTAEGNFDELLQNRLPPADYAVWRAEWERAHAHPTPASTVQAQQFAKIMQMLTAPDAEAALLKRVEPQLAGLNGTAGQPLPIFTSVLQASLKQMIETSPQLGPAQRQLAEQGLDALAVWAAQTDFSSKHKARQAIDIASAAARELNVKTLAEWRAQDYAHTMQDYGILFNAVLKLAAVYGLDLADSLDNAKATVVTQQGDTAQIRLDLDFAGRALTGRWPMQKIAGHWYDSALLDAWRKAHPAALASTETAPASAASAATAVTTATPVAPAASAAHR